MRLGVVTLVGFCVLAVPWAAGAGSAAGDSAAARASTLAAAKPRIRFVFAGVGSTATSLVVGGAVDDAAAPASFVVEYGRSAQYGSSTEPTPLPAASGGGTAQVRVVLTGLEPETRYSYRLVVTSASGSVASQNRTIVSGGKEPRISGAFVRPARTPTSIVLGATVDTGGLITAARAECGRGVRSADVLLRATPTHGWMRTKREARFVLNGLEPGKHYTCRLLAFNEAGSTAYQRDFDSGKRPRGVQYPSITVAATPSSAVIGATIDTGGLPTLYYVDYGQGRDYGSRTATRRLRPQPGKGWSPTTAEIRARLTGLTPARTYYYRIVAKNSGGTRLVSRSFVSEGSKPSVSYSYVAPGSGPAAGVVTAAVDTGGLPTTVYVEYGTSVAYGTRTADRELPALPAPESFRPTVGEARSDEVEARSGTIHYRVVATNAVGTASSSDRTYTVR